MKKITRFAIGLVFLMSAPLSFADFLEATESHSADVHPVIQLIQGVGFSAGYEVQRAGLQGAIVDELANMHEALGKPSIQVPKKNKKNPNEVEEMVTLHVGAADYILGNLAKKVGTVHDVQKNPPRLNMGHESGRLAMALVVHFDEIGSEAISQTLGTGAAAHVAELAHRSTAGDMVQTLRAKLGFGTPATVQNQQDRLVELFENQRKQAVKDEEAAAAAAEEERTAPVMLGTLPSDMTPLAMGAHLQRQSLTRLQRATEIIKGDVPTEDAHIGVQFMSALAGLPRRVIEYIVDRLNGNTHWGAANRVGRDIVELLARNIQREKTSWKDEEKHEHFYDEVVLASRDFDPARMPEIEKALIHLGVHSFVVNDPTKNQSEALARRGAFLTSEKVNWVTPVTSQAEFLAYVSTGRKKQIQDSIELGKEHKLKVVYAPMTVENYERLHPLYVRSIVEREQGGESLWELNFARYLLMKQDAMETVVADSAGNARVRAAGDTTLLPGERVVVRADHGLMENWINVYVEMEDGTLMGGLVAQFREKEGFVHGRMMAIEAQFMGRDKTMSGQPIEHTFDYHVNDLILWEYLDHLVRGRAFYASEGRDLSVLGTRLTTVPLGKKKSRNGGMAHPTQRVQAFLRVRLAPAGAVPQTNKEKATGYVDMVLNPRSPTMQEYFRVRGEDRYREGPLPSLDDVTEGRPDYQKTTPAQEIWGDWGYMRDDVEDPESVAGTVPKGIRVRVAPVDIKQHFGKY